MLKSQTTKFAPSAPTLPLDVNQRKLSAFSLDSPETVPSAPLPDTQYFENPVTQIELTVSARSLLNLDQLTRSDPLCVVFLKDSTTVDEWIEFARTESIINDLNPEWKTKIMVDYRFEEKQMLTFMVFDKDCAKYSLENHDFLGKIECSIGEIVSAPNSKLTRPLKLPSIHASTKRESIISIVAEETGDCKKFVTFGMTYYAVKRSRSKVTDSLPIFKSGIIRKVKGNLETPLRLQIHQIKHSFRGKSSKLIGETLTNFIEIYETLRKDSTLELQLLVARSRSNADTELDKLIIYDFKIEQQKTFMDYIHDGLDIKFAVAIDFTASNGEATLHSSLHYKHGKRDNPYVTALKAVGEILQDYSVKKEFYAYGFGAKGFPIANRVNHKFSLNLKETNPLCQGIEGVLSSYYRALQRVKLYGPTCFAPVIREVTEIAKRNMKNSGTNEYYVLLILTDGVVCDPETTMDALVQASETPLSVIIIGIGYEDFTIMEKFDSDEKLLKSRSNKCARRDIVQFVELRKYINFKSIVPMSPGSKAALARSVLAELPQQVISWMNSCKS